MIMLMVDLYGLAIKLLKKLDKESPGRVFTNKSGDKVTIQDVVDSLSRMRNWLYPALRDEDITRVVRCKNCMYYKKYRKKGALKSSTFSACCKDMQRRDPSFFCKDGEER